MKYSINEFALEIRNQYPNDYDDLSDEKLVELWLKKYPEDWSKITFNKTPTPLQNINHTSQHKNQRSKSSSIVWWIAFVMIVIVLAATNPNKELHVLEFKGILKKYMSEKITSAPIDFFGLGSLLEGLGNIVIDTQIDDLVERKNYFIFSLTYVKYENKEEMIGYGVLGNVFIFDSVKKLISEKLNENSKL